MKVRKTKKSDIDPEEEKTNSAAPEQGDPKNRHVHEIYYTPTDIKEPKEKEKTDGGGDGVGEGGDGADLSPRTHNPETMDEIIDSIADPLSRRIADRIRLPRVCVKAEETFHKSGSFDHELLPELILGGRTDVFRRDTAANQHRFRLVLLVDVSGSMSMLGATFAEHNKRLEELSRVTNRDTENMSTLELTTAALNSGLPAYIPKIVSAKALAIAFMKTAGLLDGLEVHVICYSSGQIVANEQIMREMDARGGTALSSAVVFLGNQLREFRLSKDADGTVVAIIQDGGPDGHNFGVKTREQIVEEDHRVRIMDFLVGEDSNVMIDNRHGPIAHTRIEDVTDCHEQIVEALNEAIEEARKGL